MIVYKIHPAIGICRVGNSPTEFFIGPERPGERPNPPGGFKDSECRIKRQAARFRIFKHDTDHPEQEPLDVTETCVDIKWTVKLRKLENPDFSVMASVEGRHGRTLFPTVNASENDPSLTFAPGEIRTDDSGRLVVLGGFGAMSYPLPNYDDRCEGSVDAKFWLTGEDPLNDPGQTANSAWVVVTCPRYAPHFDYIVTAYDVAYERALNTPGATLPLGTYSTTITFGEHIFPILERARNMRWLNEDAANQGAHMDWIHPEAPIPNEWLQTAANRQHILSHIKLPNTPMQPMGLDMPLIHNLTLTSTQYAWMVAFADPAFAVPNSFEPAPPGPITAHGLDRAALEACCGGPFSTGVELNLDAVSGKFLADDPFRLDVSSAPVLTPYLLTPWVIDLLAGACQEMWPIASPGKVRLTDATTADWARQVGGFNPDWPRLGFIVPQGDQFVETERCDVALSIVLLTPTLDFGVVPKGPGGTQGQALLAIVFEVVSINTTVSFTYDTPPSDPFSSEALPDPVGDTGGETQTVRLWIRYLTPAADDPTSVPAPSHDATVTVLASNGQLFSVKLHAVTGQRIQSAVALVLDCSGSMNELTSTSLSKHSVLVNAATAFLDVALDGDYIQLVRYDTTAHCVPDGDGGDPDIPATATNGTVYATKVTRLDTDPGNSGNDTRGVLKGLLAGSAFTPSGSTSIGAGIEKARQRLQPASLPVVNPMTGARPTPALLILTDGKENTMPFVSDEASLIDANTYAVGLGKPENTSAAVLQALAGNHGGYLLITGDVSTNSVDAFLLEKYFLQILASVNKAEVLLDPEGSLEPGESHAIPFYVTELDTGIEVILVTPLPKGVHFAVVTPHGRIIDGASAQSMPEVTHDVGTRAAFYRIALPVEEQPSRFAHVGRWHAVVKLKPHQKSSRWSLDVQANATGYDASGRAHDARVPYSLLVHSYSALKLRATMRQRSFEPGSTIELDAALLDAGVRPVLSAHVWGELSLPGGATTRVAFYAADQPGQYSASFVASTPGVYRCRVRATASSPKGCRFAREQTLTAAVWFGGDSEAAHPPGSSDQSSGLCELLHCLLGPEGALATLGSELGRHGVDIGRLRKCVNHACTPRDRWEHDRRREAGTPPDG